jgi:hypothetical protein
MNEVLPFKLDDTLHKVVRQLGPRHRALKGAEDFVNYGVYDHKWALWRTTRDGDVPIDFSPTVVEPVETLLKNTSSTSNVTTVSTSCQNVVIPVIRKQSSRISSSSKRPSESSMDEVVMIDKKPKNHHHIAHISQSLPPKFDETQIRLKQLELDVRLKEKTLEYEFKKHELESQKKIQFETRKLELVSQDRTVLILEKAKLMSQLLTQGIELDRCQEVIEKLFG